MEHTYEVFVKRNLLGLIKFKGSSITIAPGRFLQMQSRSYIPWTMLQKEMIGVVRENLIWIIIRDSDQQFYKVPFVKNDLWFNAMTSEAPFHCIKELPQIFITGVA